MLDLRTDDLRFTDEEALVLPYSPGPTQGQLTRLKALKRAMFGRANFDLLRQRFLAAP